MGAGAGAGERAGRSPELSADPRTALANPTERSKLQWPVLAMLCGCGLPHDRQPRQF